MTWWQRYRRLWDAGVLGMNRRNAECILDLNPRAHFPAVDSKKRMHELCAGLGIATPELYGIVATHSALGRLPQIVAGHPDFVIKPNRGAAGRGVLVVAGRDGDDFVRHNGRRLRPGDVFQHVSDIVSGLYSLGGQADEALIQHRVVPHPAFEKMSHQGTADVRLVVYRHVPAAAMLRLPTGLSGGRANLHQGAVGAGIDLETGVTCHAVLRNRRTERHPDTGHPVTGFAVPYWPEMLDIGVRISHAVKLGYVGVDIVLDREQGPLLLEANARPGLAIQIANGRGLVHRLEEIDHLLDRGPAPPLRAVADAARPACSPQ